MNGLEITVRFIHLASVLLLVGTFSFDLLVSRPAVRVAGAKIADDLQSFSKSLLRMARWSLWLAAITAILGLFIKIATAADLSLLESFNPSTIVSFLSGTQFGTVWLVRMVVLCLLAAMLSPEFFGWLNRNSTQLFVGGSILSAILLMSLAVAGHASAAEGTTLLLRIGIDALHLLAAGVWLGGLIPLVIFLNWIKATHRPSTLVMAQQATARFSRIGFVSVTVLFLTGLFNAWYLVGAFPPLLGTNYGYLLLAKLGILIPLMGLASRNRWRLKPGLSDLAKNNDFEKMPEILAQLRRSVIGETVLGAAILVIVAIMGITPPARHVQPGWPFPFRLDWTNVPSSADVRFALDTSVTFLIIGTVLLVSAVAVHRYRRRIVGAGAIMLVISGLIAGNAISIDAYPTTYMRPSVAYNAISVANGIALYAENCAVCHGAAGYGDGSAAENLKPKPADLTARHAASHTAGDLYWWLSHGVKETAMPGFEQSFNEDERWDLINFLRALSNGERARSLAPVTETDALLVAPDFVYGTNRGDTKTLKDHRGEKIVLLVLVSPPESRERLQQLDKMAAKLTSAGVEIILVPSDASNPVDREINELPVVAEGMDEIFKTYALFSHSFEDDRNSPAAHLPKHTEFLIDKSGYIRARWIAREGNGWRKIENLFQEIDLLQKEKSQAPAPDDHVH
ncbi:MAG TPA: copper homeostasis membrane protein CopD [Candidatus Binatia bacterium]|nr:copper homeostasis membrane protein CopD [Candidatus Binatia bacterium]